jgi:hypothetical protein
VPEPINDTDELLRRVIFADPRYIREDQTVSSFAFTPRKADKNGLSVDVARLTTYEKSILDKSKFRLYAIRADQVRQIGLNCKHDPLEDNYAHALIVGKITHSLAKRLANLAVRVSLD